MAFYFKPKCGEKFWRVLKRQVEEIDNLSNQGCEDINEYAKAGMLFGSYAFFNEDGDFDKDLFNDYIFFMQHFEEMDDDCIPDWVFESISEEES